MENNRRLQMHAVGIANVDATGKKADGELNTQEAFRIS
jgi:hypothetical protein